MRSPILSIHEFHLPDSVQIFLFISEVKSERERERETLLNNILRKKDNCIGHILKRNCLLHDAIEGQMTEEKRAARRRTELLDNLRNRRRKKYIN